MVPSVSFVSNFLLAVLFSFVVTWLFIVEEIFSLTIPPLLFHPLRISAKALPNIGNHQKSTKRPFITY